MMILLVSIVEIGYVLCYNMSKRVLNHTIIPRTNFCIKVADIICFTSGPTGSIVVLRLM